MTPHKATISDRLVTIQKQINQTAQNCQRSPESIRLIGITKKKPTQAIKEAYQAGLITIGENYVQEFCEKYDELSQLPLQWHFVGHLQRRKAKDVVGRVQLIHSLDSLELGREINKRAGQQNIQQACLVQVNIDNEDSKFGLKAEELAKFLKQANEWQHMIIKGLMVLPAFDPNPEQVRPSFRRLRELRDEMNHHKIYSTPLTELSMGMSHDYLIAIQEGATLIRLGQTLFGERK